MLKKLFTAGSLVLGLGLFVFVIGQFGGFAQSLAKVQDFGWLGMAVYLSVSSLTLVAPGIAWTILMRGDGLKVPLWTALKANFMGFPINFIAPTMYLGSEPLKMIYVSKLHGVPNRSVLATIVVAKFQEVGAHLTMMLVAAGISVWRIEFTRKDTLLIVVSMLLLLSIFGLALWGFVGNHQPSVKLINVLALFRRRSRKLARLRARAREMEAIIHASFTRRWKTFLVAQAVTMVSALGVLFRPWIFFYFARDGYLIPLEQLCAIFLVTNVINSLPHTPGGLGIFEGGMMGIFEVLGLGKENAGAFAIVTRACDLILILLGSWLIVHLGLQSLVRRVAEGKERINPEDADGATPP